MYVEARGGRKNSCAVSGRRKMILVIANPSCRPPRMKKIGKELEELFVRVESPWLWGGPWAIRMSLHALGFSVCSTCTYSYVQYDSYGTFSCLCAVFFMMWIMGNNNNILMGNKQLVVFLRGNHRRCTRGNHRRCTKIRVSPSGISHPCQKAFWVSMVSNNQSSWCTCNRP